MMLPLIPILLQLPSPTVSSLIGFFEWLNTITGGIFWTGILLAIFTIELFAIPVDDILPRLMVSGFSSAAIGMFLYIADLTNPLVAWYLPVTLGLISVTALIAYIFSTAT